MKLSTKHLKYRKPLPAKIMRKLPIMELERYASEMEELAEIKTNQAMAWLMVSLGGFVFALCIRILAHYL